MQFGGFGVPATVSSGFSKVVPNYGKFTAPGFGKGFGKPFAKPFGKGFGKIGKPFFGKGFGKGFGKPYTKAGGFSSKVPATKVVTGPSVI